MDECLETASFASFWTQLLVAPLRARRPLHSTTAAHQCCDFCSTAQSCFDATAAERRNLRQGKQGHGTSKDGSYRFAGIAPFACVLEAILEALRARHMITRQLPRNGLLLLHRKRTVAHRAAIHGDCKQKTNRPKKRRGVSPDRKTKYEVPKDQKGRVANRPRARFARTQPATSDRYTNMMEVREIRGHSRTFHTLIYKPSSTAISCLSGSKFWIWPTDVRQDLKLCRLVWNSVLATQAQRLATAVGWEKLCLRDCNSLGLLCKYQKSKFGSSGYIAAALALSIRPSCIISPFDTRSPLLVAHPRMAAWPLVLCLRTSLEHQLSTAWEMGKARSSPSHY